MVCLGQVMVAAPQAHFGSVQIVCVDFGQLQAKILLGCPTGGQIEPGLVLCLGSSHLLSGVVDHEIL